jgi:hypothetical protein
MPMQLAPFTLISADVLAVQIRCYSSLAVVATLYEVLQLLHVVRAIAGYGFSITDAQTS